MAPDVTVSLKGGVEMIVPGEIIDGFSEEVYNSIFAEGLKVHLSKGMAGTKDEKIGAKDVEKIEAKAKENLQNLINGKLKKSRATKAKGASGAVMVEARRLAKNAIKQEAKRQGIKVSHLDPKEITVWANELLASSHGVALVAQAQDNLNKAGEANLFHGINLGIHADDRRAEKVNAKNQKAADAKAKKSPPVPQKVGQKPQAVHAQH